MKLFFQDWLFYRATGYRMVSPEADFISLNSLNASDIEVEERTIIGPLYTRYDDLSALVPENQKHKIFYIWRDPRDYLISSYYSLRYTHSVMGTIDLFRKEFEGLSDEEGLRKYIEGFKPGNPYYDCLQNWCDVESDSVRVFRYEDLFGENQRQEIERLLHFLEIDLKSKTLDRLLYKYSFQKLRDQSKGDRQHLRSGKAGQYKKMDKDSVLSVFEPHVKTLCERMQYN